MALFTSGPAIGQISGSVSGSTFSHNRGGTYIRNKSIPVNPSSSKQSQVRSALGNISQVWRGLTLSQRTEWNTQAGTVSVQNALGQSYTPSGFQYFMSINTTLVHLGKSQVTTPPAGTTQQVITSASVTAVGSTGVVTVTFAPAIASGANYILRGAAPRSAGISFVARSQFKDLAILTNTDTSPFVATAAWAATFGSLTTGDVGKRVWFQLVPVTSGGLVGTPIAFSVLVS